MCKVSGVELFADKEKHYEVGWGRRSKTERGAEVKMAANLYRALALVGIV